MNYVCIVPPYFFALERQCQIIFPNWTCFLKATLQKGLPTDLYLLCPPSNNKGSFSSLCFVGPCCWWPLNQAWIVPCCCCCPWLCWPKMMWQCHVSASECRCYRLNGFSLLKRLPLSADAAGSRVLEQSVGEWLEHVGFPQYESKLLLNGFDDLRFMVSSQWLFQQSSEWTEKPLMLSWWMVGRLLFIDYWTSPYNSIDKCLWNW